MNRKLRNAITALSASGSVLLLALAVGMPVEPTHAPTHSGRQATATPVQARPDTRVHGPTVATPATGAVLDKVRFIRAVRRGRHGMAMPYFSFAPRG